MWLGRLIEGQTTGGRRGTDLATVRENQKKSLDTWFSEARPSWEEVERKGYFGCRDQFDRARVFLSEFLEVARARSEAAVPKLSGEYQEQRFAESEEFVFCSKICGVAQTTGGGSSAARRSSAAGASWSDAGLVYTYRSGLSDLPYAEQEQILAKIGGLDSWEQLENRLALVRSDAARNRDRLKILRDGVYADSMKKFAAAFVGVDHAALAKQFATSLEELALQKHSLEQALRPSDAERALEKTRARERYLQTIKQVLLLSEKLKETVFEAAGEGAFPEGGEAEEVVSGLEELFTRPAVPAE